MLMDDNTGVVRDTHINVFFVFWRCFSGKSNILNKKLFVYKYFRSYNCFILKKLIKNKIVSL